jgi:hypothetical protein
MSHGISQETLYAYVDNELNATDSAKVEAAMAGDPALKSLIEEQRALRALLGNAYSPVLDEPVPERIMAAAQAKPAAKPKAKIVRLAAARERKQAAGDETAPRQAANDWTWKHWGSMAACLVVGVFAGYSGWLSNATHDVATIDGKLVARGQLAQALSTQLASAQTKDAPVKIGLSYVSKAEELCRSFTVKSAGTDGLACRRGNEWMLRVIEQEQPKPGDQSDLRMAASPVPAALLKVVDEQIQGSPLDAEGEKAAMNKGWRAK